jgi:hypothetical protein
MARAPDTATLSWWRSPTALASTASSTKTWSTPSDTRYESSQATEGILVIGADRSGRPLEVVILDDHPEQEPIVIHAMTLRAKFHRYVAASDLRLADQVAKARTNGRTWTQIGAVLGVSKQAARERFGEPAHR